MINITEALINVFYIYLVLINIVAFITYGTDKQKAIRKEWRIKESMLILLACIGGALGAFLGMYVFRHKTKKIKFVFTVPVLLVVWGVICYFIYF